MDNTDEGLAMVPSRDFENDRDQYESEKKDSENGEDENVNGNDEETNNPEDDEEFVDRYEHEIEESVADFIDEEYIGHNTIPESSDEEEDDLVLRDRKMRKRSKDKLALGTAFYTGFEFKEAVLEYALSKAKNIVQDRWDKTKLSFKCGVGGKCKWRIYCSYDKASQKWLVKSRYKYHSCTPNGKCKILKSPVIARLFLDKLRQDNGLMPEKIQEQIKDVWKLVASRNQCQRGRLLDLKWLEKEYAEQFAHLRGYVKEILHKNPGSSVVLETIPNVTHSASASTTCSENVSAAGSGNGSAAGFTTGSATIYDVFNRFYVCFEKLKSCWRKSCRPIIGLDGTFLKFDVKGILLTAIGHDANNQIYPVAWAVVQAENSENWLWFIKLIKVDLGLGDGSKFVLISDSSKGLISAIKTELPNAEHRKCVKHIVENFKKKHKNKDFLKPMVWNLAWSYNTTQFEENRKKIEDYSMSLYEDVMKEDPKSWSLAYYRLGSFCEDVDNNATESFNSTITKARGKAIVPMLETIRRQAMVRIEKRRKKSLRRQERFTKYVVEMLESEKAHAEKCTTVPATYGVFDVTLFENSYDVNTTRKTCSCGK